MVRVLVCAAVALVLAAYVDAGGAAAAQAPSQREHAPAFALRSSAFGPGKAIPSRYTCDGSNTSPPLSWRGTPRHTASFTLIVDDPDAPSGVFTHWVLFNLPAGAHGLRQGQPRRERLPGGAIQGQNTFGQLGYGGPCPPPGPAHRYRFSLYALGVALHLEPGASKEQVLRAMRSHLLGKAQLIGRYKRKGS